MYDANHGRLRVPEIEQIRNYEHSITTEEKDIIMLELVKKLELTVPDQPNQPYFDVFKSLKDAPPITDWPGMRHIKRTVVPMKYVIADPLKQARKNGTDTVHIKLIEDSFTSRGFMHDKRPPTAILNNITRQYEIQDGHARYAAIDALAWEFIMIDVYEFATPADLTAHKLLSNMVEAPRKAGTQNDIERETIRAIAHGEIENTKPAINAWLRRVAPNFTDAQRNKVEDRVIRATGTNIGYRTYSAKGSRNSVSQGAVQYNLPHEGSKGRNAFVTECGYVAALGSTRMVFANAIKLFVTLNEGKKEVDIEPIWIFGYIIMPGKNILRDDRKHFMKNFNDSLTTFSEFYSVSSGTKYDISPFIKFGGFLPQDMTPDSKNGGLPKETTVVDEFGNPYDFRNP